MKADKPYRANKANKADKKGGRSASFFVGSDFRV